MKWNSKKWIVVVASASAACCIFRTDTANAGQSYTAPIALVQSPNYGEDCVWFTLVGVPQADPLVPNNPWFALSRSQTGYSEIYSIILAAKLSGALLNVVTTGAAAGGGCGGYPGITYVILQ